MRVALAAAAAAAAVLAAADADHARGAPGPDDGGSPRAAAPDGGARARDLDDDVVEHLDVLERLDLLEHLELFDAEGDGASGRGEDRR